MREDQGDIMKAKMHPVSISLIAAIGFLLSACTTTVASEAAAPSDTGTSTESSSVTTSSVDTSDPSAVASGADSGSQSFSSSDWLQKETFSEYVKDFAAAFHEPMTPEQLYTQPSFRGLLLYSTYWQMSARNIPLEKAGAEDYEYNVYLPWSEVETTAQKMFSYSADRQEFRGKDFGFDEEKNAFDYWPASLAMMRVEILDSMEQDNLWIFKVQVDKLSDFPDPTSDMQVLYYTWKIEDGFPVFLQISEK